VETGAFKLRKPQRGDRDFHLGPKLRLGPHFPEALLRSIVATMTCARFRIFESEYAYLLTDTILGWLPVFTRPEARAANLKGSCCNQMTSIAFAPTTRPIR
jgi:hypothetical protein